MSSITHDDVIQRAIGIAEADDHVDVVKLAQSMDIDVYAKEEEATFNAEISYDRTTKKYFIIINANHPLERQRFSIAHELAHYVLHLDKIKERGLLNRDGESELGDKLGKEADALAAEILMPEELVIEYAKKTGTTKTQKLTVDIINSIADHFKVSRIVAILRMRHLGYYAPYLSFS